MSVDCLKVKYGWYIFCDTVPDKLTFIRNETSKVLCLKDV